MDINLIIDSISVLAHGIFLTLSLTLLSLVISFILSVPLSLLRASPNRVLGIGAGIAGRAGWRVVAS